MGAMGLAMVAMAMVSVTGGCIKYTL